MSGLYEYYSRIILIGRQFGSGVHDIGKTFAENLGYWGISVLLISIQCSIIDIEKGILFL